MHTDRLRAVWAVACADFSGPKNPPSPSPQVLRFFWDLASLDESTREQAASSLVQELAAKQAEFEKGGGGAEAATDAALTGCCPLMVYAVKRLCRGLASSRQGARQGFALALAGLLQSTHCISPAEMIALLASVLEPSSSAKGSEARDALLGMLFGYGAVVRGTSNLQADAAELVATAVVQLAARKSFLREAAGERQSQPCAGYCCMGIDDFLSVCSCSAFLFLLPSQWPSCSSCFRA